MGIPFPYRPGYYQPPYINRTKAPEENPDFIEPTTWRPPPKEDKNYPRPFNPMRPFQIPNIYPTPGMNSHPSTTGFGQRPTGGFGHYPSLNWFNQHPNGFNSYPSGNGFDNYIPGESFNSWPPVDPFNNHGMPTPDWWKKFLESTNPYYGWANNSTLNNNPFGISAADTYNPMYHDPFFGGQDPFFVGQPHNTISNHNSYIPKNPNIHKGDGHFETHGQNKPGSHFGSYYPFSVDFSRPHPHYPFGRPPKSTTKNPFAYPGPHHLPKEDIQKEPSRITEYPLNSVEFPTRTTNIYPNYSHRPSEGIKVQHSLTVFDVPRDYNHIDGTFEREGTVSTPVSELKNPFSFMNGKSLDS